MQEFKKLLLRAKMGDKQAMQDILDMYQHLILKESVVDDVYDPDLRQQLYKTLLVCIHTFTI